MKLTQAKIATLSLPKGATDKIFFDDKIPGFGLRIREGGSRKWVLHYRRGSIQRRLTLGPLGVLTLEEARRKAAKALVGVDEGRDPATEKATNRAAAALTFAAVVEDYLTARAKDMKPRSHAECSRHLRKLWKAMHGVPLGAVNRSIIAAHMRKIEENSGPAAANRARSTLSAMFGWAMGEGLCELNPVIGANKATEGKTRERVLLDNELAAVWKMAPANDYGRIVRLLMLTGQRREEIGSLRWPEIDKAEKLIRLPAERTKNGRAHGVPLSRLALSVLDECDEHDDRDLIFGTGEGGFSGWSKAKAALDDACGVKGWTLHDLRRTAATRMADLGVQPHVIEAVLNHVSGHKGGVAGIYNRSTYEPEKRAALDMLATYVRAAVAKAEGANVVTMKAKAKRG